MTNTKLPQGNCIETETYKFYIHQIYKVAPQVFTVWITTPAGTRSPIGTASSKLRAREMYDAFYLSKNL